MGGDSINNMVKLKTLCYSIKIIIVLLIIAIVTLVLRASSEFSTLSIASERYEISQDATRQLRDGSIYLTEQVRHNIATGEKIYMDNYFREANETRRRDKAVETLKEHFSDNNSIDFLADALNKSNILMNTEFHAMKLVAVAKGYDINNLEPKLKEYPLSKEESAASYEELMQMASELVNGNEYEIARNEIMDAVDSCTESLVFIATKEFKESKNVYKSFMKIIKVFIGIILILNICFAILLIKLVVYPLNVYQECIINRKVFPEIGVGELRKLAKNYNAVYIENTEINNKLRNMSMHDGLTGVYNRAFLSRLENEPLYYGNPCTAAIMLDVDFFKKFNDTYGHLNGDICLRYIATCLLEFSSDEAGIYAIRYGGEEFLMLYMSCKKGEIVNRAKELHQMIISGSFEIDDNRKMNIKVSLGCCEIEQGSDILSLINHADQALYEAKHKGKNQVCEYKHKINY